MPAKNHKSRMARSAERRLTRKHRVPTGVEGTPQGKHLSGFKGMKLDIACFCGGCHPNAKANANKTRWINA